MSHTTTSVPPAAVAALLADHSLEITARGRPAAVAGPGTAAPGARVNITALAHEDLPARVAAAQAVRAAGQVPVPHIAARRLASRRELVELLTALADVDAVVSVCVVAGDSAQPAGPYPDSLALLRSGELTRHGVRDVAVAGYPEGHPRIPERDLWNALREKAALLEEQGLTGTIVTQFSFDVDRVLSWVARLRRAGVHLPVRVGVPGPIGVRQLLAYATRFGVASSASAVRKYGFSLTDLLGTAGPDLFVRRLAEQLRPEHHGTVKLHFYTFGGPAGTASLTG